MKKVKMILGFMIAVFILTNSCSTYNNSEYATVNNRDPYLNMQIIRCGNSQAYFFPNSQSDKLIIVIEGYGFTSVLGIKDNERWYEVGMGTQLLPLLRDDYAFLIPEKFTRQPGKDYTNDMEDRERYTIENLLKCYMESINGFLDEYEFTSIIMIGCSEGACLLPLVYFEMDSDTRKKVTAMVSIGYGGLSLYESYLILNERAVSQEWKDLYSAVLDLFRPGKTEYPDTFDELFYDTTFRYINSLKYVRPFDYYRDIDVPIFFVHGLYDPQNPVESMFYVAYYIQGKPFTFMYYPWGHQPETAEQLDVLLNDINEWIRETDK